MLMWNDTSLACCAAAVTSIAHAACQLALPTLAAVLLWHAACVEASLVLPACRATAPAASPLCVADRPAAVAGLTTHRSIHCWSMPSHFWLMQCNNMQQSNTLCVALLFLCCRMYMASFTVGYRSMTSRRCLVRWRWHVTL